MTTKFSLKRAPGFTFASFSTVLLIGRRGTIELQNDKAGRKTLQDVARWAYSLEKELGGMAFRLVPSGFPELPCEEDGREQVQVDVAFGRLVGSCPYQGPPTQVAAYLQQEMEKVAKIPDRVWEDAESKLGAQLGVTKGGHNLTREIGRILVPAGVGLMSSFIVGVKTSEEPKRKSLKKGGPHVVENWRGVYGHVWTGDGVTELEMNDAHLKGFADELRPLGQPCAWLGCVRV